MRVDVLSGIKRRLPLRLVAARRRIHQRRVRQGWGLPGLVQIYASANGTVVKHGTFAGLRYDESTITDVDLAVGKLAGTYECELAPFFRSMLDIGVSTFVNVGCAEGYYAVGMAMADRGCKVLAYDIDASARRQCRKMALLNGVGDRLEIRSRFDETSIRDPELAGSVLLMDVEGAEDQLVSPSLVSRLGTTTICIEVHESHVPEPGLRGRLEGRLRDSHHLAVVEPRPREGEILDLAPLDRDQARSAASEHRSAGMCWLIATPRAGPPTKT